MVIFTSQVVVLIVAVTIIVMAGWGLYAPEKLMTLVTSTMDQHWGMYVAVAVRLALGAALVSVAPASMFPSLFEILGWITIAAAVALIVAGRARVRQFILWWAERFSAATIRLWLLFGIAFGGLLVYGVL